MPSRQKPNSMMEWVAGRNITPRQRKPSTPRGVLKLEVYTDDENETDTLAVTYPRNGSRNRPARQRSKSKQVKFNDVHQEAMSRHRPAVQQIESDLEVETSGSEESVEPTRYIKPRKRAKPTSPPPPPNGELCWKELPAPSEASDSEEEDIVPHSTCPCAKCVYGRKLLKKAKKKAKEAAKAAAKVVAEGETKAGESPTPAPPANNVNKGDDNTTAAGDTAPKNGRAKRSKAKSSNKATSGKTQSVAVSSSPTGSSRRSKRLAAAYPPAEIRSPNLIMPVRAQVLQVEHAVESPEDPRPNAFIDNEHGICRVYHGPAYGNPYGSLYPRRGVSGSSPYQALPAGVPHPMQNPYYHGFDPKEMAQHGQPPGFPPSGAYPPGTGYVPPPPPVGYPPPHPEMAYPTHMPWQGYPPPEGYKGYKKVPSPVVPPVVPPVMPPVMPAFVPPAAPPVEEPRKAAAADVTEPQKFNDRPHSGLPLGLLTPRTIAAKFSDKPAQSSASAKGKDKDHGWNNNVGPKDPSHKSGSHHSNQNGGNGNGWGGGSHHPSNAGNNGGGGGWGGGFANNPPRPTNNNNEANGNGHSGSQQGQNGGGNGWGGSNHHRGSHHNSPPNNDGGNEGWGGGSHRSGSKKSSNHSRNSANQPAANIAGEGWGGGWDNPTVPNNSNGNDKGWSGGGGSNGGGHNNGSNKSGGNNNNGGWGEKPPANNSPRGSNKDKGNNNSWGSNHGSNHNSGKGSNQGNNGWGNGNKEGEGSNHRSGPGRHNNSPPSGDRHASGNHNERHHTSGDHRGRQHSNSGGNGDRHRSSSRMPGSWDRCSVPSNNIGPQGTPGGLGSRRPSGNNSNNNNKSPKGGSNGSNRGRSQAGWGGNMGGNVAPMGSPARVSNAESGGMLGALFSGGSNAGGGGAPAWGDKTAAQSTKGAGGNW